MATNNPGTKPRFISLRWRLLLPIFVILLVAAMVSAYALAISFEGGLEAPQIGLLLQASRAVGEQAAGQYDYYRQEAQRIAFTRGVPDLLAGGNTRDLRPMLEGLARLADLDSVVLADADGQEVIGLLRADERYAVNSGTDLRSLGIGSADSAALVRTPQGLFIFVGVPINRDEQVIGRALVGARVEQTLEKLRTGVGDVILYDSGGTVLQTTLAADANSLADLTLSPDSLNKVANGQTLVRNFQLAGQPSWGAYFPFVMGSTRLGILGVMTPNTIPFSTNAARQLTGLVMASLAGALVVMVYVGLNLLVIGRLKRITRVAQALSSGQSTVRTHMQPSDEIGLVGRALDQYANYVQERQDALRVTLRRQRRENERLLAVLESLPDGVVVQDVDGRVIVLNQRARQLLGSAATLPREFDDLTSLVTDVLGIALAPGLYALGDPHRVELEGRMLSAQAAAVMNAMNLRVGTVIVLRDITDDVRRERAREDLLKRVEREVQQPLTAVIRPKATPSLATLARELTRHAVALQKLVVEMREVSTGDAAPLASDRQQALHLDTLVWTIANEWRQVASAANLTFDVVIAQKGLHVLGDERRLRWAIGNIVDNAIKYTLPGGKLSLEVQGENNGRAMLRLRDNGVGIAPDELPNVCTRFYRGNPTTADGRTLRIPGTGQGLSIAKQVIESHGGAIQIKSKPGVGTAVYFALPLTAPMSLELPQLQADMEGETVRLQVDEL